MKHLKQSLPILASMLGKRHGVEVRFSGPKAYTDGKRITLPILDTENEQDVAMMLGYLVHEAGHIRHTDFSALDEISTPLHKKVANILEDVWLEKRVGEMYPGSRQTLHALVSALIDRGKLRPPGPEAEPAKVLTHYMLAALRCEVLNQDALKDVAETACKDVETVFGRAAWVRLNALMHSVTRSTNSHDNVSLAAKIIRMLEEERDRKDPPPNCPDGQEDDQAQGENDQDETPQAGDSDAGDESMDDDADNQSESGEPDTDGPDSSQPTQSEGDENQKQIAQAIQSALEDQSEGADPLKEALEQEINVASTRSKAISPGCSGATQNFYGTVDRHAARSATNRLSLSLRQLLESQARTRKRTTSHGRRMSRRLDRVSYQDPRLFIRQTKQQAVNTAVYLLLDRSLSMGEDKGKMALAGGTTLAAMQALRQIRHVASAAAAFPGVSGAPVTGITGFSDSLPATEALYGILPSGGTPLLPALWHAAQALLERNEPRKILLVVTDGKPDKANCCTRLLARMEASGIECLGLGIEDNAGEGIFPSWQMISAMEELPQALFGMLRKTALAA